MKKSVIALLLLLLHASAMAADFKSVHARGKLVVILTPAGKVITVREQFAVRKVRMAPNRMAVAWLLVDLALDENAGEVASFTLVVYRHGKRRTLTCNQIIRDYWFWERGQKIAYDCGGTHFAGTYVLFDTRTLKEIARFDQADVAPEKVPAWSASSDAFTEH